MSASSTVSANRADETRVPALWLAAIALLVALMLLFAFQRVVHTAVDKAQADRLQQTDQAHALWECNQLPSRAQRRACTAQLEAVGRTVRLPDVIVSTSK